MARDTDVDRPFGAGEGVLMASSGDAVACASFAEAEGEAKGEAEVEADGEADGPPDGRPDGKVEGDADGEADGAHDAALVLERALCIGASAAATCFRCCGSVVINGRFEGASTFDSRCCWVVARRGRSEGAVSVESTLCVASSSPRGDGIFVLRMTPLPFPPTVGNIPNAFLYARPPSPPTM